MKPVPSSCLLVAGMLIATHAMSQTQAVHPNQARADADLARQRAESLAVQKKNEQTDKEDRSQYEARKKAYEQEARRKEDQLRRQSLVRENPSQKAASGDRSGGR